MEIKIIEMNKEHWNAVSEIYMEGIKTKVATFQGSCPEYDEWDKSHLKCCRLVAINDKNNVIAWAALSPTSSRCVYKGVAEVSIYVSEKYRGNGVGELLLNNLIEKSEEYGIWTLQSAIIEVNSRSISLHKKCGFRVVGIREKLAKDNNGIWQNVVFVERRSKTVGIE